MLRTGDQVAVRQDDGRLTPRDVRRLFGGGYVEVDVQADGTIRHNPRGDGGRAEPATRTLKTQRTWY